MNEKEKAAADAILNLIAEGMHPAASDYLALMKGIEARVICEIQCSRAERAREATPNVTQ